MNSQLLEIADSSEVTNLVFSQLYLDSVVIEKAKEASPHLLESKISEDQELGHLLTHMTGSEINRNLCLFCAVGTGINIDQGKPAVTTEDIANVIKWDLLHHRASVPKDLNPSGRYYFGEWWACSKNLTFFHHSVLPLLQKFSYHGLSVVFDKAKGVGDLLNNINSSQVGVGLSVVNHTYLKNRFGNLIKEEHEEVLAPIRTETGIAYSPVPLDSHVVLLVRSGSKYIIIDSFNVPLDQKTDSELIYEIDLDLLTASLTGKAFLFSKNSIDYSGSTIKMLTPTS